MKGKLLRLSAVWLLCLAFPSWAQRVAVSEWGPGGWVGMGLRQRDPGMSFFTWVSQARDGAAGVQIDTVLLGNLRWHRLSLEAASKRLPEPWDSSWSGRLTPSLNWEARSTTSWAAWLGHEPLWGWGVIGQQRQTAGLGILLGEGQPWLASGEVAWSVHDQISSRSWYMRPLPTRQVLTSRQRLGLRGEIGALDGVVWGELSDRAPPRGGGGIRGHWAPWKGWRTWGLVEFYDSWSAVARTELKGGGLTLRITARGSVGPEGQIQEEWEPVLRAGVGALPLRLGVGANLSGDRGRTWGDAQVNLGGLGLGLRLSWKHAQGEWSGPEPTAKLAVGEAESSFAVTARWREGSVWSGSTALRVERGGLGGSAQVAWSQDKGVEQWSLSLCWVF